jgi:hypothetical protein
MAYYIFLKSWRSLEEFRKNPHVKIPPKSPSTNFQSLGQFKNPIFNSEIPFSLFSAGPTLQPVWRIGFGVTGMADLTAGAQLTERQGRGGRLRRREPLLLLWLC